MLAGKKPLTLLFEDECNNDFTQAWKDAIAENGWVFVHRIVKPRRGKYNWYGETYIALPSEAYRIKHLERIRSESGYSPLTSEIKTGFLLGYSKVQIKAFVEKCYPEIQRLRSEDAWLETV